MIRSLNADAFRQGLLELAVRFSELPLFGESHAEVAHDCTDNGIVGDADAAVRQGFAEQFFTFCPFALIEQIAGWGL